LLPGRGFYDVAMPDTFTDDFSWGVATSAYQIEGGRFEGGKGESIWDRFADEGRMPETGDVACDHYHRWREDIALMKDLGVRAYRFSIAWTRVMPDGVGPVNVAGIAFYRDLIEALLEAGIAPWPTLYHWDLPQALQDRGGWANRDTAEAFAAYADATSAALGDRVSHWITHNEPWVATFVGHVDGRFAPGVEDWGIGLRAAHHLLLSHGLTVAAIRRNVPGASVGIALDCRPARPASPDLADQAAARHFDGFRNRWFFDPVFGRGYPSDMVDSYHRRGRLEEARLPFVEPGDLETIAEPIDFLGLNYYTSLAISAGSEESEETAEPPTADPPDGYTEMGWPITPAALTEYLQHLATTYEPAAIVITENGASYSDAPGADGAIHDVRRIAYLDEHTDAVATALAAGVPVAGYFVWSLLDNLEWTSGYSQRFGLVWVDHETGERVPKDSYLWYRDRIARA
jgi:beta-glucosidase